MSLNSKKSRHCPLAYASMIPRINVNEREFVQNFLSLRRPVVMPGLENGPLSWPARDVWQKDRFLKDHGDFVVVKNIEHIKFTGNKFENKKYYRHTGYPGGIKETTPEKLHQKKPEEVLKLAVKRMLPGGALGKKQLSKLKVYVGEKHPHESQSPELIDVSKLNNKNIVRN